MSAPELVQTYPSPELIQCPYPFLARLRDESPVYKVPDRDEYLLTRHEDIVFAMKQTDLFSTEMPFGAPSLDYEGGKTILTTDEPEHTGKRKLVAPPFTPGRLREIEPMVQRYVDLLIDRCIDAGELDFTNDFAFRLPMLVISDLMGMPTEGEQLEALFHWARSDRTNLRYMPDTSEKRRLAELIESMLEYFAEHVRARIEAPHDDIVGEMVTRQIERDGEPDVPNLVTITAELVAGGASTTANMLASSMMLLLQHPDTMAAVRADHSLIPPMLEETLRLESPIQWRPRYTLADVEIGGTLIPAGSVVNLVYASANRDPACFERPEEFDPARDRKKLKEHFGFGFGIHYCLGSPLARLEGRLAYETMFRRMENIAVVDGENDFTPIDHLLFRAPRRVYLRFDRAE